MKSFHIIKYNLGSMVACCMGGDGGHKMVQSSFLSTFPSLSRFSISRMTIWKISWTLCEVRKEATVKCQ